MFDLDVPGPCPLCGTAHHTCKSPDSAGAEGVGVTRGTVIVRLRDAGSVTLPASVPAASRLPEAR